MTMKTLTPKQELWRAEVAVVEFLRVRLGEQNSLNTVYLNGEGQAWGEAPTFFSVEIHVEVGTSDEMKDAVLAVLDDALRPLSRIFPNPEVAPIVVFVRDGDVVYARHVVCLKIEAPYEHGADVGEVF